MTNSPPDGSAAAAIVPAGSRRRVRRAAAAALRKRLRLPPRLTLSQWADLHRRLSPESAAEPGPWRTERVPYLREILDTISGREYADVTIVKSSQTAGTEALNNAVGYYIDQEPSPILMIQPNVKPMAEAWSKDRLAPMLRDCPRLRGKVKDPRARDSGNTVLHKTFPGGYITAIGANSPAGLASRPIRIVLADELDRWSASAGTEGDPLSLAEARTITFRHRRKVVKVSTPGNAGESRIEKEWAASDQRHYHVPCPHCGEYQPLEWRDSGGKPGIVPGRGDFRLVWEKEGEGDARVHKPETTVYVCRACGAAIEESEKPAMLAAGRWVKHNPVSARAGFHISGLLSPWVRWKDLAAKWLKVKDDNEQRRSFYNTLLGLLYVEEGEQADAGQLAARREAYPEDPERGVLVPAGVGILTAAADVQGDRLEVEVRGWGEKEESWQIRLERLYGDPDLDDVWEQLQAILDQPYPHVSGAALRIRACMVDSGYKTDRVYRWVRPRQVRRVFAVKGVDGAKEPIARASRANRDGVKVFSINPVKLKDVLFGRLRRPVPGAGYLHFGLARQTGADDAFFDQYGAERRVVEFVRNAPVVRYIPLQGRRNEAIDLYVYNLAALRSLGFTTSSQAGATAAALQQRRETSAATGDPVIATSLEHVPQAPEERPSTVVAHPPARRNGTPRSRIVRRPLW